ncbi:TPA: anti-phage protein GapS2 [Photobacterium damselae]
MNVFELLGIESGDAISVNNPWSNSGYRDMIPLSLSRNGISIRAIDCRYGDIRYISSDWIILTSENTEVELKKFPYIRQKLLEWSDKKNAEVKSHSRVLKDLNELQREFATIDEVLNTLNLTNLRVAVTGALPLPRAEFKSLLESKGAIVVGSVSNKTSFLFMGDTGKYEITSKMAKAHTVGVKVITL